MAISLDRLVGVHHKALQVRTQKMEVISGNLANANTPGYKARDIDFQKAMKSVQSGQSPSGKSGLVRTHDKHIAGGASNIGLDIDYRLPDQADTGDGNSVDVQVERNNFLDTGMRYEAGLMLLNGKFKGLKKAISSGQ